MALSLLVNPLVAVLVGMGATLALVVAAAQTVWASPEQLASWITAGCLAMAATSAYMSWRTRLPVVTAWSTAGAALVASSSSITDFASAVGAFSVAALLVILTSLVKPLGRLIQKIPSSIASAMLAGILLQFVLAVFESARTATYLVLPLVAVFLIARRIHASTAILVVLVTGLGLSNFMGLNTPFSEAFRAPQLVFTSPRFELSVVIGVAIPLYLVTMASQNLPGVAVLRAAGYDRLPASWLLGGTGIASMLTAPLGAHTNSLAAITASICTGPDTHPDTRQRWKAGLVYGAGYLVMAVAGASLVGIIAALPSALITTVAGLALVSPLLGALAGAMERPTERFAAVLTLAVTASGLNLFGIGAAFWGLLLGLAVLLLDRHHWPARKPTLK